MNTTILFLTIMVLTIIIFDVYIIKSKGKHESISAHIIRFGYKHRKGFFTGLIVGVVLGHLFWSMNTGDVFNIKECTNKEVLK